MSIIPPENEEELLGRIKAIEGLSFGELAAMLGVMIPNDPTKRKGLIGSLIENVLGTTAGTQSKPDFCELGIELKTIPIGASGGPIESTFVTSINLLNVHKESWEASSCCEKLKRVLWILIEGDKEIPFQHRRIGKGFLWSANPAEQKVLKEDWELLSFMLGAGNLEQVDGTLGQFLQVRPKAANARALCYGFGSEGHKVLTLPRGFYLRALFTAKIIQQYG